MPELQKSKGQNARVCLVSAKIRLDRKRFKCYSEQLTFKNELHLLCSHLQWRKKCHLLWLTFLFTSSAQGHASSHPGSVKPNTPNFHTALPYLELVTNTKQNKISMVQTQPAGIWYTAGTPGHPWSRAAHKSSRHLKLTKDRLPGDCQKEHSPSLSQDDWKVVCPKADKQNSP